MYIKAIITFHDPVLNKKLDFRNSIWWFMF